MEDKTNITEPTQDEDALIVVKQLPVIEEQLKAIKERFRAEADAALSLACTEETLQSVKKKRAELTKVFSALETKRKEAKKAILAPYEAFEQVYKACVTEIYTPCDRQLAAKIREVEDGLKAQKRTDAEEYFAEYCLAKGVDFLAFDRLGITVTLSSSKKALREQIKTAIDRVAEELALIATQENSDEIFVEYKTSLNVAQAITQVANRHKAIEEERRRKEAAQAIAIEKAQAAAKVDEAVEAVQPPKAEPVAEVQQTPENHKEYKVVFSVIGTIEKIRALKQFLVEGGYQYDQQ